MDAPQQEVYINSNEKAPPKSRAAIAETNGHRVDRRVHNTDQGNAERLVARHGRHLHYIHPWRKWLTWSGRQWRLDDTGGVLRYAKDTVRGMFHEAEPGDGDLINRELANHAIRSEAKGRIEAMIALAQSEPGIPVLPDQLDKDPWLLNVQNGTIDLRSGHLRVHKREDLITKMIPVAYDPDAKAPTFEAFLERILPSPALRSFLQKAIGYAASGEVSEEILVILHGTGDNGKTTLINAILEALGDYAMQAANDLLLVKRGAHPTELTDLFGTRFVSCSETDDGRRLAEALVKQLTGRERIRARGMREDFWEFSPTHTIFLATNHRPEVRGTDHAIWRRIKLVPFEVKIPEGEKDTNLPAKLREELPGILAWIVAGCLDYQREGLGEPDEVRAATETYRAEMDVLAAFIEDRCAVNEKAEVPATRLFNAYKDWARDSDEEELKQRTFGMRLKERGFENFKYTSGPNKDRSGWRGIGLRAEDNPPPEGGDGGGSGPKTSDDPPLGGGIEDYPPRAESRTDKGNSHVRRARAEDSGPENNISTSGEPRVALMPEHPPLPPLPPLDDAPCAEKERRIAQLVKEGMAEHIAREQVLGKANGYPLSCLCEECLPV